MSDQVLIKIQCNSEYNLPTYQTIGSSGMDIRANINKNIGIWPGKRVLIPTGIRVEIPEQYEIQIRTRSGLAIKYGIFVLNSPGTIDSDYRGEIKVILSNSSQNLYEIKPGERIAQMVLQKVEKIKWKQCNFLEESERGSGGFGSTGEL